MSDTSNLEGDITVRFRSEIARILERALRLSNRRELRVRADNRDMVLGSNVSPKDVREFAETLSLSYVHITNLGRPSDRDRLHWKCLRFATLHRMVNTCLGLLCTILPAGEWKNRLYRLMGMSIGEDVEIAQGAFIDPFCPRLVTIGHGTVIGALATVFTHIYRGGGRLLVGPVVLGANCVISGTATVAPGVMQDEVTVLPNTAAMPLLRRVKRGGVVGLPTEDDKLADVIRNLP